MVHMVTFKFEPPAGIGPAYMVYKTIALPLS